MKTKIVLLYSKMDLAGLNMAKEIEDSMGEQFELKNKKIELISFEREVLYARSEEELGVKEFDFVVVLSRHSGTPHHPIFTAHVPGNFGRAKYGGKSFKLGVAIPSLMKEYLQEVSKKAPSIGYWVGFEPTHHGPTLDIPMAFLEIGCDETSWNDPNGVNVAANSVIRGLENWETGKYIPAIAFGGPHINEHFTNIALHTDIALGHTARKLDAEWVDKVMIQQAIDKNGENPQLAIIDNKGLKGEDRRRIESALRDLDIKAIRVKKLLREKIENSKEREEV